MPIRIAALLVSMLLLGCSPSGGDDPRIVFERFTVDANGNLDAVFRLENRSAEPIEAVSQYGSIQWYEEVRDASEEDGWGEPEFGFMGCGNGIGWTEIEPGATRRGTAFLRGVEGAEFRMNVRARRPSLLHLMEFEVGEFDVVSDEVPYPWPLDALGPGVTIEDPVFRAAFLGDAEKVRALLDAGSPIDSHQAGTEATPLHAAAARGHVTIMQSLIEKGAPLEALAVYGRTPLWWAIFQGEPDAVRVLLEAGADPDHHGPGSMTPLAYAEREKLDAIAELLRNAGALR